MLASRIRTMSHLQHPLFHMLSLAHDTPRARASCIVQITHSSLLHDVHASGCASEHAVCVHNVGMGVVQAAKLRILIAACRVLAQRRAALGKYLLLQFRLVWLVFVQLQCTSQQGAGHPLGLAPPQRCPGRLPGFWLQLEPGFLQVRKFRGRFVR